MSGATSVPTAVVGVPTPTLVAQQGAFSDSGRVSPEDSAAPSTALSEIVQSVFEYMPATLVGMVAVVEIIILLFWKLTPPEVMLPWLTACAALWLARCFMLHGYRRALRLGSPDWPGLLRVWNLSTLVSGVVWGLGAWVFYGRGDAIQQTGLIIVLYSYCIAAVPVLASQPRIYFAFATLCFVPMIVRIAMQGDGYSYQLAGELLLIASLTTLLSRSYRQALQRVTELKLRADGLLLQLRVEKQAADAARHEAEVANRAKTQFFTAASHDLRQPLHAMGLFAEALRQRTHEPEVARLVNSINESVDALESLFSELLDITRIDSGRIEVQPEHFAVDEIFRKLKLHFEPAAFEKGLALRLRGGHRAVHGDPLLLERVLRNLVSNAIRYTDDGSVLVSCRRRGARVLLQVWDTGMGISPAERDRVFEEFYQVPGQRAAGAEQRKGLGLGLAIVQRLAKLMAAPLSLRSQLGRGSVFTLELPYSEAARAELPKVVQKMPAGVALSGRLIVVVEDDQAVRAGLEVVLKSWGATLASFDSAAAAQAWVAGSDPARIKPALLIVDYRLEQARTGIEVIAAMRSRFGAEVPAIVVTGSTMTGPEWEAQNHDFHLLVKPVLPYKLRAMIAFKLGVKPALAAQPA